jgi:hypothetical protein
VLNPDAFTLAPNGATGNFIPNSLLSPFGISQTDIALRRRLNLTECVTLDFRIEYFKGLGGGGLQGGQSALYAIGGPRSGQFTLKLQF